MGEIKSVKVDNWGVFFLQKLQNFFNKTDYCDLTLQFRDNSQLKVHRLVLSACTDYFNVLEQTCEMVDDALIMPNELQADVVVPIVNFMYTGTLEFELKMYGKLLRTAREMNMTVLLKLLEAHRRTMEGVNRAQRPPSPKTIRRRNVQTTAQQNQPRRILTAANTSQQRIVHVKSVAPNTQTANRQQVGVIAAGAYDTQQVKQEPLDNISPPRQPTSPFEQLRKGYNNNKRPTTATFVSPPIKRPNIEDVKEFAEQQRMRKQIAAEYGDDHEDESMLDDDIHNYDDDDDATATAPTIIASTSNRQQMQQSHQVKKGSATITFKQEQDDKNPTIVVKDTSNSKMNHAKIISEVLRQYPHLVKSTKNIKLKILPNAGGQKTPKKEPGTEAPATEKVPQMTLLKTQVQSVQSKSLLSGEKPIVTIQKHQPSQQAFKLPVQKPAATNAPGATTTAEPPQKRRIDSKTMYALIALGAENTKGPWLCLRCGVSGRPISIPSYRSFRRHLINTHKETIDAALCEHCGWRSTNSRELHYHILMEHHIKNTLYSFPNCLECGETLIDSNALQQHRIQVHNYKTNQQCIYCNKIFAQEMQLYTHMKTYHKKQALDDGIIDESDGEEFVGIQETVQPIDPVKKETKIKILSDISLPIACSLLKLEPSGEISASTNKQSTKPIIGSIDQPKFVNADGNEMILTDEQRKQIIAQLNREHDGGNVVMMFNDAPADLNVFDMKKKEEIKLKEEEDMETEEHAEETYESDDEKDKDDSGKSSNCEDFDDNQIYREFNAPKTTATVADDDTEIRKSAAAPNIDESKESAEHLEWAENLISEHELADDLNVTTEDKTKKDEVISKKLQELTGDWTDDENDNDNDNDNDNAEEASEGKPDTEPEEEEAPEDDEDEEEDAQQQTEESAVGVNESSKEPPAVEEEVGTDESAEVNPSPKIDDTPEKQLPVNQNESNNTDEDDAIDLALESIHKDIESDEFKVKESPINEEDADVEKTTIKTEKLNESDEKMDVDVDEAEEFVKLGKSTEKKRPSLEKKATDDAEDVPEEIDNKTRKNLLDELIAEANKSVTDDIETHDDNLSANLEDAPEPQKPAADSSEIDVAVTSSVNKEEEQTEAAAPESEMASSIGQSEAVHEEIKAAASAAASPPPGTADKVKSLIKEWIDEEDGGDDDDDNGDDKYDL